MEKIKQGRRRRLIFVALVVGMVFSILLNEPSFTASIQMFERGLYPCTIIERNKRGNTSIDVCEFFTYTPELEPVIHQIEQGHSFNASTFYLDAETWVNSHIVFKNEAVDFWNFPNETLASGFGDCEDFSILLANLLLQAGYPYHKVLISVYGHHVVVDFDGHLLDATGGGVPSPSLFWYCWNARNAYTSWEHIVSWKR